MKRLYLALVLGGMASAVLAGAGYRHIRYMLREPPANWSSSSMQWQAQVMQQSRRSQRIDGSVVFLGDSLTVGLTVSNITAKPENFGINGDTIDGLMERIPRYDLSGARAIVVQIGINNWAVDRFRDFGGKYRRMLSLLPSGIPVTAISLTPINGDEAAAYADRNFADHTFAAAAQRANAAIAKACVERPPCDFIDLSSTLADSHGRLRPRFDSGDGLHLSSLGYDVWERSAAPLLQRKGK